MFVKIGVSAFSSEDIPQSAGFTSKTAEDEVTDIHPSSTSSDQHRKKS